MKTFSLPGTDDGAMGKMTLLGMMTLLALRLIVAGNIELLPEEAYYWTYSKHPAWSYFDHPPMVAWVIGAGAMWLFLLVSVYVGVGLLAVYLGWVCGRWQTTP